MRSRDYLTHSDKGIPLEEREVGVGENGDECEDSEIGDGVEGEEEQMKRAADVKYERFGRECGDLLDPALLEELSVMKSLGLPTKLINCYNDMECEEVRV